MNNKNYLPLKVYGSEISYFTGKLENYLKYKEIPYERIAASARMGAKLKKNAGVVQIPTVNLADGRWMSDSTPIIEWFEQEFPETSIIPTDPEQAFFCRLLEDYSDEPCITVGIISKMRFYWGAKLQVSCCLIFPFLR